MILDPNCFLCSDLSDRDGAIAVTSAFRIAADIAPLIRDHCLFCTTKHRLSFSSLSQKMLNEAAKMLASVSTLPIFSKRSILYFEHGPSEARLGQVGCCDHAHIHILPIVPRRSLSSTRLGDDRISLLRSEERAGKIRFVGTMHIEELKRLHGQNYFWIGDNIEALDAFIIVRPERQYLRQVAAKLLGATKYQTWDMFDNKAAKRTTRKLRSEICRLVIA